MLRRFLPITILALLTGCDFVAPGAASAPLPVIEGILVSGRDSQIIRVRLARSADSAFVPNAPETRPDTIAFMITGHGVTQVAPTFRGTEILIPFLIHPDSTYTLTGMVDGIPVSATTTVPHAVTVDAPVGDTVVVDSLVHCPMGWCGLTVAMHGSATYGYSVEFRTFSGDLRIRDRIDGAGTVLYLDAFTLQTSTTVDFLGLDENAASFLQQTEPRSSIVGGFGVFGSAVAVRRPFRYQ